MSESSQRIRSQHVVAPPNTPEELEAATARYRAQKKSARYQIGCWNVVDVPLPLLAQYIAELPAEDQREFLKELHARMPASALQRPEEDVKE
jgi:hypothetical protein